MIHKIKLTEFKTKEEYYPIHVYKKEFHEIVFSSLYDIRRAKKLYGTDNRMQYDDPYCNNFNTLLKKYKGCEVEVFAGLRRWYIVNGGIQAAVAKEGFPISDSSNNIFYLGGMTVYMGILYFNHLTKYHSDELYQFNLKYKNKKIRLEYAKFEIIDKVLYVYIDDQDHKQFHIPKSWNKPNANVVKFDQISKNALIRLHNKFVYSKHK